VKKQDFAVEPVDTEKESTVGALEAELACYVGIAEPSAASTALTKNERSLGAAGAEHAGDRLCFEVPPGVRDAVAAAAAPEEGLSFEAPADVREAVAAAAEEDRLAYGKAADLAELQSEIYTTAEAAAEPPWTAVDGQGT